MRALGCFVCVVAVFALCSVSRGQLPEWDSTDLLGGTVSSQPMGAPATGASVSTPYLGVSQGGVAVAVFNRVDYRGILGSYTDSLISTCTAHGDAWTTPANILSGTNGVSALAVSPSGKIVYALETDQNLTLTNPFGTYVLSYPQPGGGELAGTYFGTGSSVLALRYDAAGKLGFLLNKLGFQFYRSDDDGSTWTSGVRVDTQTSPTYGAHAALSGDGSGNWICCWDTEGSGTLETDVYISRSSDDGNTWGAPVPLCDSMDSDVISDGIGDVAAGPDGEWIMVWRSHAGIGDDSDIMISRSSDEGASWSTPEPLVTDFLSDWTDDYGPSISCDGRNGWIVTWISGGDSSMHAASTDSGNIWQHGLLEYPYTLLSGNLVNDGAGRWLTGSRFIHSYTVGQVNPIYVTETIARVRDALFNAPTAAVDWRLYD